jgi:chromosome segregation ATPase
MVRRDSERARHPDVIEQVMIFALGFLVSGLLTLMFLPAFWRRALRLSRRRLEMQMPLSMAEIVAERDQLRAEFATERRRIEQHCEALVVERARDMGELGRRARLIGALDTELADAKRKVLEQDTALDLAERRIADAEGQFAAADKELFDMGSRLARVSGAAADLDRDNKALAAVAEERRAAIAASETRAAGLVMQVEGLRREREALIRAGTAKDTALQRLGAELDFAKTSGTATASKLQVALAKVEELGGDAGKLQGALADERRANLQLEAKARVAAQSLTDAAEREAVLRAELDRQAATLRAADQNNAQQISALRAENSSLQGALQAAHKELAVLRAELATARNGAAPIVEPDGALHIAQDDAMLRQTIKEIGTEVSRLMHTLETQSRGEAAGAGPGELMRALQARAGRTAPSN